MRFTKEDVQHYREISDACLAEVLDKYEEYLYRGDRHIDERRWKKVKSREGVVVYRERSTSDADLSTKSGHDFSSSSSSNSSGPAYHARHDPSTAVETVSNAPLSGPGAALAAGTKIPVMICTATIPGTLEDAMYGSYVDDAASFRRRSAYEQDLADDIGMLATFDRPSQKDPFQFMGLTWILRSFPDSERWSSRATSCCCNASGSRGRRGAICSASRSRSRCPTATCPSCPSTRSSAARCPCARSTGKWEIWSMSSCRL